jgi:hypothetical protein
MGVRVATAAPRVENPSGVSIASGIQMLEMGSIGVTALMVRRSDPAAASYWGVHGSAFGMPCAESRLGAFVEICEGMGRPRLLAERATPRVAIPEIRWRVVRFMGLFSYFLVLNRAE